MPPHHPNPELVDRFCKQYLEVLSHTLPKQHRTYGFEYEFMPHRALNLDDMADLDRVLAEMGGRKEQGDHVFDNGIRVTFEPGGQIEYCSPPLPAKDFREIDPLLSFISRANTWIYEKLAIQYIGTDAIAGRANAPLCLQSPRYVALHRRLARSGSRGHEMMKGTASIHLHVAICNMEELLPLFYTLCEMTGEPSFQMSKTRRNIWSQTDSTRCGPPPCCFEALDSPSSLIARLIQFALQVVVLGEEKPFEHTSDQSFDAFLYHMTTIFTDVRFNLKGPTLELRTPDSVPLDQFKSRWELFVSRLNSVQCQKKETQWQK
ncbi:MAG: hypothetical protein ACQERN_03070 [Thermodesulfobacteriota bacterium]